jgi:hypothetical protein
LLRVSTSSNRSRKSEPSTINAAVHEHRRCGYHWDRVNNRESCIHGNNPSRGEYIFRERRAYLQRFYKCQDEALGLFGGPGNVPAERSRSSTMC